MPHTLPIHTLNATIGILCVIILALTAHASTLADALQDADTQSADAMPADVRATSFDILYWPGVGGIVDCLLFIWVCVGRRKTTGNKRVWTAAVLFVASFIVVRPLVVLIYTFAENARGGTVEGWACMADGSTAGNAWGMRKRVLCREGRAARWLLVPVLVGAVGMLGCVCWGEWVGRKKTAEGEGLS
ncbi:hypothetical protein K458DRAFT_164636 [Lentithecium fluviatile CBS 122367]|uniref:Integral membrane protein n=1 Tax=Lentithecium fluviatile CBS 122367 TaxID=1168545 RepID=A0A6G1IGC8_9PLEO|nr:hypothetical protein K458DRAFT_164636 [Lentithecium fluviatile CBS 122367]